MNKLFLSFLLAVVIGVFVGVSAENCCSFPISSMSVATNVTARNFRCKEPIFMQCAITAATGPTQVAIAGFENRGGKPEILHPSNLRVSTSLVCNTSTEIWHLEKETKEYEFFACAYKNAKGGWDVSAY